MVENDVMSKACEICNSEYLIDSKYCPTCGSKNEEYTHLNLINEIKEDVKKSKYYESISVEEISNLKNIPYANSIFEKICPKCKHKNSYDSLYCEECGIKLTDSDEKIETNDINEKICPNCGTIASEEDNFCSECGTKL